MSMRQHPSYQSRERRTATAHAEPLADPEPAAVCTLDRRYCNRACCCTAPPVVIVMMQTAACADGGSSTELLLCGHHFRASMQALAAAGATILDIKGHPLTAGAWPEPA
jgi:hypothetical protein